MKWWEEEYALEDDLEEEMIMVGRVQGEAVVSTAPCTLPTLLLPIPPHALPTLPQPMRPEGGHPTMRTAPEAPLGLDKWCQAPHPVARAWPSGDSEAPAPDRLSGMAEVFSMTAPDGEVLMGAAAVGPDVGSLGLRLDGSVRDDYLCYMQRGAPWGGTAEAWSREAHRCAHASGGRRRTKTATGQAPTNCSGGDVTTAWGRTQGAR